MSRTIEEIKKELEEMQQKQVQETEEDIGIKVVKLLEEIKKCVKNTKRDLLFIFIGVLLSLAASIGAIIMTSIK